MFKSYGQLIAGILIGLVAGIVLGRQFLGGNQTLPGSAQVASKAEKQVVEPPSPVVLGNVQQDRGIPQKVYSVLNYIRSNHQPAPGYIGGRVFSNREELLPWEDNNGRPILYHEWDVNPKEKGQNRGTERIITGSDGRAWYTNDHYRSFREIK